MPLTDEDAAIQAIANLSTLTAEQQTAESKIGAVLASEDPFIDLPVLFSHYSTLYFRSLLVPRVEILWSSRLTLCAGICELVRDPDNNNKYTRIRLKLSEPLLKFRPRSDVIDTLLHEAIHAYFFVTTFWRHSRGEDGTGHGAGFQLLADAINEHGGYGISVFHTFHDEVESYRTHVWQCDGVCRHQAPFFGLVKRTMNRAPGKGDVWWKRHLEECGGTFVKVAEPEMSKAQIEKLTGLERAGRQGNKIDAWVKKVGAKEVGVKRGRSPSVDGDAKKAKESVTCPICSESVGQDEINEHLDSVHPP